MRLVLNMNCSMRDVNVTEKHAIDTHHKCHKFTQICNLDALHPF